MNVVFYNHFHNGDVHASRGFVRQIMSKVTGLNFIYTHRNASNLLSDIPNLKYDAYPLSVLNNNHAGVIVNGNDIFINTWYGQQHFKYMNRYGITIDSLYAAFDEACRTLWNFSLSDIQSDPRLFFPSIDYSKFEIAHAKAWLDRCVGRKVYVETAQAQSGQAHNFAMTPAIVELAQKHPDITFILSNQEGNYSLPINVAYSASIIQKSSGSDLNENSFLSTYCDIIVGRASGAFTFALTQENLFVRSPKFLCFSNLVPQPPNKWWMSELLRDKVNYNAQFIVEDVSTTDRAKQIIDSHL